MPGPEIAFLDIMAPDVQGELRDCLPQGWSVNFAKSDDKAEKLRLVKTADFIVGGGTKLERDVMAAAPKLKMIHKYGIGVDKIDLAAAGEMGIPVAITAGGNAGPVAEHAVMLMLAVNRRLPLIDRELRRGRWMKSEMRSICYQVSRKTVGIVGFGNIGRMVAQLLRGFSDEILYYDTRSADPVTERALNVTRVPLDELLQRSDIVTLHAPLTKASDKLINATTLRKMKKGAILINTARGELVDEAALYEALKSGHLRGAGLDTFVAEPPAKDNPLLTLDQVVVTPHTAGGVFDNVANVGRHIYRNIQRVLDGEALPDQDVVPLPKAPAMRGVA